MRPLNSETILRELGYDFTRFCSEAVRPELAEVTFRELIPFLKNGGPKSKALLDKRLYSHQLRALEALESGKNVVLISGTGSGKTEAWVVHALRKGLRVLAVYPTLALAADQIVRIEDYYSSMGGGRKVVKVDRPTLNVLGRRVLGEIKDALVVITNPAFLMSDLKRVATSQAKSVLLPFISSLDLIAIDEFDFYGSRGASLILALIELITTYLTRRKPQVAILTATLGNPDEVAEILTGLNGYDTEVIVGKPFKPRNCVYVIHGKNLDNLRKYILDKVGGDPELRKLVEDPQFFRYNVTSIIEYLRSLGIKLPSPYLDVAELLSKYLDDEGVTLVFTPSIKIAERIARSLKARLPKELSDYIATHHHLVSKELRAEIEHEMRSQPPGRKVVVTVRTLLQGIDIGNVVRIVHYGLPVEVREFHQREGRKGRTPELEFTETIIIPVSPWDRLAVSGRESLRAYAELPLEKVYVVKGNEYVKLFKALFKAVSNQPLTPEELNLLKSFKLVEMRRALEGEEVRLTSEGIKVWNKFNFYEFGPPYGIPVFKDGVPVGEEVSLRDFIEKYQEGCFDYISESVVVDTSTKKIREISLTKLRTEELPEFLLDALSRYEAIKLSWGERPNIVGDFREGRLSFTVELAVRTPTAGFGTLSESPIGLYWEVESKSRVRLVPVGDLLIPVRESKVIDLLPNLRGEYRDFTYGYLYELKKSMELSDVILGLAVIQVFLRIDPEYAISLRELRLEPIIDFSGKVLGVLVWEPECSGITKKLDWSSVLAKLLNSDFEAGVWLPQLYLINRRVANEVVNSGMSWDDLKKLASRLIEAFAGVTLVEVRGVKVPLPKPGRELRVMSLALIPLSTEGESIFVITVFDGEEMRTEVLREREGSLPSKLSDRIAEALIKAYESESTVLVNIDLRSYAYRRIAMDLIEKLLSEGKLLDPIEELRKVCTSGFTLSSAGGGDLLRAYVTLSKVARSGRVRSERLAKLEERLVRLSRRLAEFQYRAYQLLRLVKEGKLTC